MRNHPVRMGSFTRGLIAILGSEKNNLYTLLEASKPVD